METKLLIVLIIVLCSCGRQSINETSNVDSVIEIDLLSEPESRIKKLSEFAADVEYIPLQTTENSLMGDIRRKIVNTDKRIYIQNLNEILCFNIDGKFLFKLQNNGRGPEEYTNIADFDVSSDNKILTILSSITHKLLEYGISDTGFTFLRSLTMKDPAPYRIAMVPETDNVFLAIPPWRGTEPTLSLLINPAGDTLHYKPNCFKYEMVRTTNFRATNEMLVYSIGDKVCFKEVFSDTVFYVDTKDNSFKVRMIFDSHGTLSTPKMRGGSETPGNNVNYIATAFETPRYVFYYYISSGPTRNRVLFDKTTKTKYKLDIESELTDDLSGGPVFNIEFMNNYWSDGKLFSFIEAITLKKYIDGDDFKNAKVSDPKKKNELKKLADSLDEADNPVLVIVTPKN